MAGITDISTTKKYENNIKNNISDNYPDYSNTDVNTNGLLSVELGFNLIKYTGTTGIKGLTHGNTGEIKNLRFSAACTVTNADSSTAQENRLYLSSNFITSFGDTLTIVSAGSLGWYEISRSNN